MPIKMKVLGRILWRCVVPFDDDETDNLKLCLLIQINMIMAFVLMVFFVVAADGQED